jgi:hypothetical protein
LNFGDALPGTSGFVAGGLAFRAVEGKALLALEGGYATGKEGEEIRASAAFRVVY